MSTAYVRNIKEAAKENHFFRKVLFTGRNSQLVLMCLQPGETIGEETNRVDQIIYVVEGEGKVVLDGQAQEFEKGDIVFVPAGMKHNIFNPEEDAMKLFTVYAPRQYADGTVQRTKADAPAAEKVEELAPV